MKLVWKVIIIAVVVICILLIIAYYLIGNYFYNIALNPKTDKTFVLGNLEQTEEKKLLWEEQLNWLKENSNDIYIESTNNGKLKLHSYEIHNESDTWVIAIHGYMSQGSSMIGFAKEFDKRGYNVLIPDLRGLGLSEGDYIGMGWHDRLDTIDWINYLISKNSEIKIILFGISMGAATTMMTIGEDLPSNVKLAIVDCGYTSVWDEFKYQLKQLFNLPEFPVLYAANTVCNMKAKYSFKEASSVEQLKKSKTPTLFIHGDIDDFVPYEMLDKVYNAANSEKEKLIIEGAGHGLASTVNFELYWKTVDRFIEKYL